LAANFAQKSIFGTQNLIFMKKSSI